MTRSAPYTKSVSHMYSPYGVQQYPSQTLYDDPSIEALQSRILYFGRLPIDINTEKLQSICEEYGDVKKCVVYPQKFMAFVEYYDLRAADKCRAALKGQKMGDKTMDVQYSLPKQKDKDNNTGTLYIRPQGADRNFVDPNTLEDYKNLFELHGGGEVKKVSNNRKREVEKFIEFYDNRHASKAQEVLNGYTFNGVAIEVQFAQRPSRSFNKDSKVVSELRHNYNKERRFGGSFPTSGGGSGVLGVNIGSSIQGDSYGLIDTCYGPYRRNNGNANISSNNGPSYYVPTGVSHQQHAHNTQQQQAHDPQLQIHDQQQSLDFQQQSHEFQHQQSQQFQHHTHPSQLLRPLNQSSPHSNPWQHHAAAQSYAAAAAYGYNGAWNGSYEGQNNCWNDVSPVIGNFGNYKSNNNNCTRSSDYGNCFNENNGDNSINNSNIHGSNTFTNIVDGGNLNFSFSQGIMGSGNASNFFCSDVPIITRMNASNSPNICHSNDFSNARNYITSNDNVDGITSYYNMLGGNKNLIGLSDTDCKDVMKNSKIIDLKNSSDNNNTGNNDNMINFSNIPMNNNDIDKNGNYNLPVSKNNINDAIMRNNESILNNIGQPLVLQQMNNNYQYSCGSPHENKICGSNRMIDRVDGYANYVGVGMQQMPIMNNYFEVSSNDSIGAYIGMNNETSNYDINESTSVSIKNADDYVCNQNIVPSINYNIIIPKKCDGVDNLRHNENVNLSGLNTSFNHSENDLNNNSFYIRYSNDNVSGYIVQNENFLGSSYINIDNINRGSEAKELINNDIPEVDEKS